MKHFMRKLMKFYWKNYFSIYRSEYLTFGCEPNWMLMNKEWWLITISPKKAEMFRKEGLRTILFPLCSLQSGRKVFCFRAGKIHFFIEIFITLFLWPHHIACEVEFPRQELNVCPALGVWDVNHWATGKCPWRSLEPHSTCAVALDIRFTSRFPLLEG